MCCHLAVKYLPVVQYFHNSDRDGQNIIFKRFSPQDVMYHSGEAKTFFSWNILNVRCDSGWNQQQLPVILAIASYVVIHFAASDMLQKKGNEINNLLGPPYQALRQPEYKKIPIRPSMKWDEI